MRQGGKKMRGGEGEETSDGDGGGSVDDTEYISTFSTYN